MSDLTYHVEDVITLELSGTRLPNVGTSLPSADVSFDIVRATVSESTNVLYVESKYTVTLRSDEELDGADAIGTLVSRVGVVMQPSRKVQDVELQDGSLVPSQILARDIAQGYHRQTIVHLAAQLGFPPVIIPAAFDIPEASGE